MIITLFLTIGGWRGCQIFDLHIHAFDLFRVISSRNLRSFSVAFSPLFLTLSCVSAVVALNVCRVTV